jgi:hypothetical protein
MSSVTPSNYRHAIGWTTLGEIISGSVLLVAIDMHVGFWRGFLFFTSLITFTRCVIRLVRLERERGREA